MKTYHAKKEEIERKWHLVDAREKTLGRMASKIAYILRGKHKPFFTPSVDTGDFVVVINADQVHLSGKKWKQKIYYHHTGYPGGIKSISAEKLRDKRPEDLVRKAVKGMLPKNPLGRKMYKKLKVYAGEVHPHQAQKPEPLNF
ncbi:MAG: 50S ribosomal protein L13 [Deltaproteobacteria bacterium]|nr:50S ribosomal protein L13 [Deltaproteobacteria bacterium]MBW2306462.1 50S ribosomal protein L13 [Deltaproteobacteria bacterium]